MRHDFGHPESWNWDRDGYMVDGRFVRLDIGSTPFGVRPIVVLQIDGHAHSVWVTSPDLRARLAGELERRRACDFALEERITIVRDRVKRRLAAGRPVWSFRVAFLDAPYSPDARPAAVYVPNAAEERGEDWSDDRVNDSGAAS
jgi:hypothetical protein